MTAPGRVVRHVATLVGTIGLVLLGGCEKTFRDMYEQPRYRPLAPSTLWPDGRSARPPVDGTVAHSAGTAADTTSGRLGQLATPPPIASTTAQLARGRERFDIFCSPCHSVAGDGDGMIARRGFPHPPSFHTDRLRAAPDAHFYAVITNGYGVMHSYATRVPPEDRLAIVAYIRALQLSQYANVAALTAVDRDRLPASGSGTATSEARR